MRSELWEFARVARIARPGAGIAASASAQTSETVGRFRGCASDFEEKATDAATESLDGKGYAHMPGVQ